MAKDLPYFKFYCSEWNDGDITLEDLEIQGLFINVCSYYWSNECNLTIDKLKKRFRHNKDNIDHLIKEGLLHVDSGQLEINFLNQQQKDRLKTSKKNSQSGKASAEKKRLAKIEVNEKTTSVEKVLNETPTKKAPIVEKDRIDFNGLLNLLNSQSSKVYRTINPKARAEFNKRIKEGYTKEDIRNTVINAFLDPWHSDSKWKWLTPIFLSRSEKIDKYLGAVSKESSKTYSFDFDK